MRLHWLQAFWVARGPRASPVHGLLAVRPVGGATRLAEDYGAFHGASRRGPGQPPSVQQRRGRRHVDNRVLSELRGSRAHQEAGGASTGPHAPQPACVRGRRARDAGQESIRAVRVRAGSSFCARRVSPCTLTKSQFSSFNRLSQILQDVNKPRAHYPRLKGKGAEIKNLGAALLRVFSDVRRVGDENDAMVEQILINNLKAQDAIDIHGNDFF